ncbi:MAG TPA: hypothetical protein VKX30_03305 [Flavobacteriaceae bacterium]|nr:hypothetical protein [Flavobacteriaceae bacterium]
MKRPYNIKSLLFSVIGIWLLLAPMLVELYHSVNDFHVSYEVCTEQTTHLHQKPVDCSICDFHPTFYTYDFLEINFDVVPIYYSRTFPLTTSLISQKESVHYFLRGPPFSA